jgi:hypothetical protein
LLKYLTYFFSGFHLYVRYFLYGLDGVRELVRIVSVYALVALLSVCELVRIVSVYALVALLSVCELVRIVYVSTLVALLSVYMSAPVDCCCNGYLYRGLEQKLDRLGD